MRSIARRGARFALALLLAAATAWSLASCAAPAPGQKGVTRLSNPSGTPQESAVADFQKAVDASAVPVFVDFYATWCPPCKASIPFVEQLAKDYDGRVLFLRVDTDQAAALAGTFNIRSIPTFYMIKGGKIQGNLSGYADSMQQDIRDLIEKALA